MQSPSDKFDYFIERTDKRLESMESKIDQQGEKIESIRLFRPFVIGIALGACTLITIFTNLAIAYFTAK